MRTHTTTMAKKKKDKFTEAYDMDVYTALRTYDTHDKLMEFFKKFGYRKGYYMCADIIKYGPLDGQTERFKDLFEIVHLSYLKDFFEYAKKFDINIEMLNRWEDGAKRPL